MKSKVPIAEAFQELVCGTILPSIRKTGKFEIGNTIKYLENKLSNFSIENEALNIQGHFFKFVNFNAV